LSVILDPPPRRAAHSTGLNRLHATEFRGASDCLTLSESRLKFSQQKSRVMPRDSRSNTALGLWHSPVVPQPSHPASESEPPCEYSGLQPMS
jgi:hypothetical protein